MTTWLHFDASRGCATLPVSESNDPGAAEGTLLVTGDWAPMAGHERVILRDPLAVYGDLLPVLRDADVAVTNLEGVIGPTVLTPILKDGDAILLSPEVVAALSQVPFHLACLANNHVMDCGPVGLRATLDALKPTGLATVGAWSGGEGPGPTVRVQAGDVRVGVLNVAEGEEGRATTGDGVVGLDPDQIAAALRALRESVDVVIAIVHAGREYVPAPAPYLTALCRRLVDLGAAAVIGHHPHVVQGVTLYRGAPIVYSLGNFVFEMGTGLTAHRQGMVVRLGLSRSGVRCLELWPFLSGADGLRRPDAAEAARFFEHLVDVSALCDDPERLAAIWDAYADVWWLRNGQVELRDGILALADDTLPAWLRLRAQAIQGRGVGARTARRALGWVASSLRRQPRAGEPPRHTPLTGRAAAVLRNRFDTLAHREIALRALERLMHATNGTAPAWAYDWLEQHTVFW